ncbi:MAG: hypothetical protein IPM34_05470 [Saprospiraceae bacterium]|jgi:hypothetical protein|nr:hypothetical protein [Saprospiraceae bacterium]
MKRRRLNTKSNLYSYLKSTGVLENGTHAEIQKVKNDYWREYKRNWRKNKRKIGKEITISFTKEEFKEISSESKRHKLSRASLIKQACFAYFNKSFIVPDLKEVKKISQILAMSYNYIQEMTEENKIDFKSGKSILEAIYKLEREILPVLNNPKSIEILIKEHIEKNAKNKNSLVEFINSI